jgi:hypothetical protein
MDDLFRQGVANCAAFLLCLTADYQLSAQACAPLLAPRGKERETE